MPALAARTEATTKKRERAMDFIVLERELEMNVVKKEWQAG